MSQKMIEPFPWIMGILNITPDSFSDGISDADRCPEDAKKKWYQRLNNMIADGAHIIDIGGESTRPSACPITWQEEWSRIQEFCSYAVKRDNILVSVDTYHVETAKLAVQCGVDIINDISGVQNFCKMAQAIIDTDVRLVVTHNVRGDLEFSNVDDPINDIIRAFNDVLLQAEQIGFNSSRIFFDPGIGFGKTVDQNWKIFNNLYRLKQSFEQPIICAVSKKSFLKSRLDDISQQSLTVATALLTYSAFQQGVQIFRVHDVVANRTALSMAKCIGT